jgi:hypothetical protein
LSITDQTLRLSYPPALDNKNIIRTVPLLKTISTQGRRTKMTLRHLCTGTYPRRGRSESCSFWHDPSSCSFPRKDKKKSEIWVTSTDLPRRTCCHCYSGSVLVAVPSIANPDKQTVTHMGRGHRIYYHGGRLQEAAQPQPKSCCLSPTVC